MTVILSKSIWFAFAIAGASFFLYYQGERTAANVGTLFEALCRLIQAMFGSCEKITSAAASAVVSVFRAVEGWMFGAEETGKAAATIAQQGTKATGAIVSVVEFSAGLTKFTVGVVAVGFNVGMIAGGVCFANYLGANPQVGQAAFNAGYELLQSWLGYGGINLATPGPEMPSILPG